MIKQASESQYLLIKDRLNYMEKNTACPDAIEYNGRKYRYNDEGCYPFLIMNDGTIEFGGHRERHWDLKCSICAERMFGKRVHFYPPEPPKKVCDAVEEMGGEIAFDGRIYASIPAITYWDGFFSNDGKWLGLTTIKKIVNSVLSVWTDVDLDKLMVQWNEKLIPYHQLFEKKEEDEGKNGQNLEQMKAIHLADTEEKRKRMGDYIKDRSDRRGKKLTSPSGKEMTQAEYHNLTTIGDSVSKIGNILTEERLDKIIKESIRKVLGK